MTHPANRIIQAAAAWYGYGRRDLLSKRRYRLLVEARHVAMYIARTDLGASYPELGRVFGGRDHTTVMNAVRKVAARLSTDSVFAASVERVREMAAPRMRRMAAVMDRAEELAMVQAGAA